MSDNPLQMAGEPIGEGREYIRYRVPRDPGRLIKLLKGPAAKGSAANWRCTAGLPVAPPKTLDAASRRTG